jgi:BASS family bile acid:Na+ symporter
VGAPRLPLLVGIGVRRLAPPLAERAAFIVGPAATVLLVSVFLPVVPALAKMMLSLVGNGTLVSFSVFTAAGLLVGHFLGGPDLENRSVLALATATRHPGIAVAIAHANFPDQKLAVPAVFTYTIVGAILAELYSRLITHKKTSPAETPKQVAV